MSKHITCKLTFKIKISAITCMPNMYYLHIITCIFYTNAIKNHYGFKINSI